MVDCLNEELEIMGYLEIKDGKASVTDKGQKKLEGFKAGLSAQDREALKV
jgi:ribosomal protein S19E (S16A)